jgi:replicative DNA helicase
MLTMITKELIKQYYRLILHETAQKYAIARLEGKEVKYPHQVIYKQISGKEEKEYKYLTYEKLEKSIKGDRSLGVMLNQDKTGLCKSGCIDIDIPRDAKDLKEGLALTQRLQEIALKSNLRAYIEFSGNRGYHLWIFANKPVIGEVMQNCLRAIAQLANFEAIEIFPNKYPEETKVIKLPFTTHLKSSLRSGFLPSNFDINNPQIDLSSQIELMADFVQNDVIDILECANSLNNQNSGNDKKNYLNDGLNYQNFDNHKKVNQNINSDSHKEIYQGEGINSDNGYSTKSNNSNKPNFDNNYGINSNNSNNYYSESYSENKPVNRDEITNKLNAFENNHPSCINFLLNNGAPLEIEYNSANLTLVRYCLTRGFNLTDSLPMAESMAKNTRENHSTGKDFQGKVSNFKSVFQSASRNSADYLFNCGYVLSGYKKSNKGKLSDRGCIGSKCSLFKVKNNNYATENSKNESDYLDNNYDTENSKNESDYLDNNYDTEDSKNKSYYSENNVNKDLNKTKYYKSDKYSKNTAKYYPLNQLIFSAMIELVNLDKEICKSNLLLKIEPQYLALTKESNYDSVNESKINNQDTESQKLLENEVLAYLIQKPDIITDYLEIFPQGFITSTEITSEHEQIINNLSELSDNSVVKNSSKSYKGLSEYIDYLLTLELPSEDTIEAHIDIIRDSGIKEIASNNYSQYQREIKRAESISLEVLNKSIEDTESLLKQSLSDKNLLPVSDKANQWLESMFNEDIISIPTFSQDLNYLLNGGLAKGKLYVLGAPPANGKSTISAQIGDNASSKGFKIGYASYEMSAEQLFTTGLSRLGKINSSLIEGKKYFKDEILADKLLKTFSQYQEKIANNLYIIEADDLYNPSRLLAIIKKLKLDLLIVDYLQLMTTGDPKLDNAYQETLRVSKIATELKRIARKSNIPIIAISDINKNAYIASIKGGDLDMGALRDSFKIAHSADVIMLLMSNDIPLAVKDNEGKKGEQMVTQLYLLAEKMREKSINLAQQIEMLAHEYRLEKETADTYSRLIIAKNRTGKCGEVLFRYSKALHYFDAMDYLTDSVTINDDF